MVGRILKIIQWNINRYYTCFEYSKLLINKEKPEIICLQESNLKEGLQDKLKGFKFYQRKQDKLQPCQWRSYYHDEQQPTNLRNTTQYKP